MHEPLALFSHPVARPDVRLDTSLELLLERAPVAPDRVLATVVATAGSTYRKAGARMLILSDGGYFGLLSGGCFESDLSVHAHDVMKSSQARAVEYDMRGPDDQLYGLGSGCEGALRVLLEPARSDGPVTHSLAQAGALAQRGDGAALVMVHESAHLKLGTYFSTSSLPENLQAAARQVVAEKKSRDFDSRTAQRERAFIQYVAPPPHLLVCGAAPDAQAVVASARDLGWRVTVVDHRPVYALAQRFPGAAVICAPSRDLTEVVNLSGCHAAVVMSHHLESDADYLRALAGEDAPEYVGLLGPAVRRAKLTAELGGAAIALHTRIRGPVGIDIGAATPEAIALSIIGQIHAWLAGRPLA